MGNCTVYIYRSAHFGVLFICLCISLTFTVFYFLVIYMYLARFGIYTSRHCVSVIWSIFLCSCPSFFADELCLYNVFTSFCFS